MLDALYADRANLRTNVAEFVELRAICGRRSGRRPPTRGLLQTFAAGAAMPLWKRVWKRQTATDDHRRKPMRPDVAMAFDRLDATARHDGVALTIVSAFRSNAEQARRFAAHPDPKWVADVEAWLSGDRPKRSTWEQRVADLEAKVASLLQREGAV
ncbi:MAG TPA: hypothetical protein VH231_10850 [Solirubrobacteraceae bacterium]|nr:hypothetical protein [Solirubrobacteraceae bacterium]